jgi:hypothetical protein
MLRYRQYGQGANNMKEQVKKIMANHLICSKDEAQSVRQTLSDNIAKWQAKFIISN